mmetsp:Transcript_7636/g.17934  ORF Transcript_7636/g.17934 Transcript_7636/m.17934 type:complete len:93 (-) Transcript_7636:182-460(-)
MASVGSEMQVQVPQGMGPGSQMQVNTAQGIMSVTVPQGVMPGQCFTFQLPAAPVVQGVVGTAVVAPVVAQPAVAVGQPAPPRPKQDDCCGCC